MTRRNVVHISFSFRQIGHQNILLFRHYTQKAQLPLALHSTEQLRYSFYMYFMVAEPALSGNPTQPWLHPKSPSDAEPDSTKETPGPARNRRSASDTVSWRARWRRVAVARRGGAWSWWKLEPRGVEVGVAEGHLHPAKPVRTASTGAAGGVSGPAEGTSARGRLLWRPAGSEDRP